MNINISDQSPEEDEDSLFGSPPSSPVSGRSPITTTLAFPGRFQGGLNIFQNVGTIALPGSHDNSEFPVLPLALNASYGPVPQSQASQRVTPSSLDSSRCGSVEEDRPRLKRKRKNIEAPRRPPPTIFIPDPSQPIPPNFLRNQPALLGHAGLASGVRTSQLSPLYARGTTAENPIVIKDDASVLSSIHPRYLSIPQHQLPTPSNGDIVATLLKQPELFKLLKEVMSIFGSSNDMDLYRPRKRRLDGADNVSVVTENAETERRGRQLLLQLQVLIQEASRAAAIRLYMKREDPHRYERDTAPDRRYRPSPLSKDNASMTPSYTRGSSGTPDVPTAMNSSQNTKPSVMSPVAVDVGENTANGSVDDLLTSLLSSVPVPPSATQDGDINMLDLDTESDIDPTLLDNWLAVLQSFPPLDDGIIPSTDDISTPGLDFCTNLPAMHTKFDFDSFFIPQSTTMTTEPADGAILDFATLFSSFNESSSTITSYEPPTTGFNQNFLLPDSAIDPLLLALSTPGPSAFPSMQSVQKTHPSIASPILSASELDPVTPSSSGWDAPLSDLNGADDGRSNLNSQEDSVAVSSDKGKERPLGQTSTYISPPRPEPFLHINTPFTAPELSASPHVILARAKERRKQLAEEIIRVRTELWEVTIEQGVLMHMAKDFS